jgi:metallo-beta-lactamase class B
MRNTMKFLSYPVVLVLAAAWGLAQEGPDRGTSVATSSKVPRWDARGVGPLPWQGVACLDVNDDATRIALGTIAPPGDPNVIVLDGRGQVARQSRVGQRWINQVAFGPDGKELFAVCTMPEGRAGDQPEVFRLSAPDAAPEKLPLERSAVFHYGDHSNHVTLLLDRQDQFTTILSGNQVTWPGAAGAVRFPLAGDALAVALATGPAGITVVGTTATAAPGAQPRANLHVLRPAQKAPAWSRPANLETEPAPQPEHGLYGKPTLPDGSREELPQRDEKVWAPLAVAVHVQAEGRWQVAAADHQGWQRWVRSSATMKEESLGVRFMPSRPAVTVYDQDGKVRRRFGPESFQRPQWCDLRFLPDGKRLLAWPHSWTARGLAGQPILPADEQADSVYVLDIRSGKVTRLAFPDAISDLAVSAQGIVAVGCWDGRVYPLGEAELAGGRLPAGFPVGGPSLVRISRDGERVVAATTAGVVRLLDRSGKERWRCDLNQAVKRGLKPWVANARAVPLGPGVWQLPGGRVESDLGGQRLVEAPDGLILIEAHAGLSFESEWAAIQAVGLDPRRVKYVLATHEHGDHAPGAYLWRVVAGARFVCSAEMAYTLQHHIPTNTGYGFHPPVPTDTKVTQDTELDLAGLKVQAVRIPGHTYGSMAWRFVKGGKSYVAFGDLIMPKGVLGYSGSINFSASDVLSSLRKLQALKPDVVLPGHGAVGGPADTLAAGIDVGRAGGWGLIRPERPDPYFRLRQKNVVVAAWNLGATSAAFGDLDGDGRPDVAIVARAGTGALVKIFLNKGGKFADKPDHEIPLPRLAQPSKIRVLPAKGAAAHLFVAGQSAALLTPEGKWPGYKVIALDVNDAHQARFLNEGERRRLLVACRFGGVQVLDEVQGKARLSRFKPEISGAYVDVQALDLNGDGREDLVTSYGQVFLRGADGKLPAEPSLRLEVEKGDWSFLAVGDFNGDGRPDVALLSYGMHGRTVARVYYNRAEAARPFAAKPDAVLPLGPSTNKAPASLLRDAPVVADWNGDGIADLVIGRGQSDEVLILLGGRDGLAVQRCETVTFDYRVHYETGLYVGDFNGDGVPDLAAFGYTLTGVGWNGPPAAYLWLQPARKAR